MDELSVVILCAEDTLNWGAMMWLVFMVAFVVVCVFLIVSIASRYMKCPQIKAG
jgi:hypothetical protein